MSSKVDAEILEALDDALDNILGPTVRRVIYSQIEKDLGPKTTDLLGEPERFLGALKRFFGDATSVLEQTIATEVARRLGVHSEQKSLREVLIKARRLT
jgi:2-phosphoglycerate kinase